MSKAFLREPDDDFNHEPILPPLPPSRHGAKNYLTPDGALRLQAELLHLRTDSRPPLIASKSDSDAKRELQKVDHRIRRLEQSLLAAEVVPPPSGNPVTVEFGTTVTVRDVAGVSDRYRIVGVDEIDAERGWISYQSPLARALLGARSGQRVVFQTPRGPAEIEIIAISYEPVAVEI